MLDVLMFRKDTLRMAVLSAFMWDPDWILNKVDVRSTSLVLVMHAKQEQEVRLIPYNVLKAG